MFCQSCGNEVSQSLSYCNQCGARLNDAADARALPPFSFNMLLAALVGIPFIGLGTIVGVIAALKNGMGFRDDFIFAISMITFFLFALAEIGCILLLLFRTKTPKRSRKDDIPPISERHHLNEAARRGLGGPTFEPAAPVGSVTDHTTRTLDHAFRDEKDS